MSCPTCEHTMQCVGNVFWCPRCGTIKQEGLGLTEVPRRYSLMRSALERIKKIGGDRRTKAAMSCDGPGTAPPSITPYAETPNEAFIYWRGVREGLSGINSFASDVLEDRPVKLG